MEYLYIKHQEDFDRTKNKTQVNKIFIPNTENGTYIRSIILSNTIVGG